jgi:exonuclease III
MEFLQISPLETHSSATPPFVPISSDAMEYTYKIATLNINGIAAIDRIRTLEELIHKHYLDWVFLLDVTANKLSNLRGYSTYINIGTEGRGTAIITNAMCLQTYNAYRQVEA